MKREWTEKHDKIIERYEAKKRAGKAIFHTYEDNNMLDWLGVEDKKDQSYKITTDELGNKTYHYRGKPK